MSSRPLLSAGALALAVLAILLGLAGCSEDDPGSAVAPDQILALAAAVAEVPADGVSATAITAAITPDATPANRTVTFTTTAGSLSGVPPAATAASASSNGDRATATAGLAGTPAPVQSLAIEVDEDGRATVFLTAPTTPASARVGAQVAEFARTLTVTFAAAGPTSIDVDPGQFSLDLGFDSSLTVTATLRRPNGGVASEGIEVDFSAVDSAGRSFGELRAVTPTDDCGQATALFTAGTSAATGPALLVARATDPATGQVVEGRATVEIVDPDAADSTG